MWKLPEPDPAINQGDPGLPWSAPLISGVALGLSLALGAMASVGQAPWLAMGLHLGLLGTAVAAVRRLPLPWLVMLTILVRLSFLPMEPAGDLNRYAWEGHVQTHGANPYVEAPDALSHLATRYFEEINHKDKTAIYPPLTQVLFHASALVFWPEVRPVHLKCLAMAADLATALLLIVLLRRIGRNPSWAALYALNPVVLWSFAGEGHIDSFMLLFLVLAMLAWHRKAWGWMFVALAVSVQVKYMGVFVVPFFIHRKNWRWLPVFLVSLLLPFLLYGPPFEPIFHTLKIFSRDFHYNGALHPLLLPLFGEPWIAARVCAGLALAGVLVIRLFNGHPFEGGAVAMGWVLLCAPTVHIWYLAWVVLFLPLRPSAAWLLVCGSISVTYLNVATWWETGGWDPNPWLGWVVWLPLLIGAIWRRGSRTLYDRVWPSSVGRVSVVIPTRNEAGAIGRLLRNLGECEPPPFEVIVSDAGSTDGTAEIADTHGVLVVQSPAGRGRQMRAGAKLATGDVVFFVHADAAMEGDTLGRIVDALNDSGKVGGSVGGRFRRVGAFLGGIGGLNQIRAAFGGISFGDQGQFFRRDWLDAHGGVPDMKLMEDVELSLRLKEKEGPLYLGGGLVASTRHWEEGGIPGRLVRAIGIIRLVARYMMSRFLFARLPDSEQYFRTYYKADAIQKPREGGN